MTSPDVSTCCSSVVHISPADNIVSPITFCLSDLVTMFLWHNVYGPHSQHWHHSSLCHHCGCHPLHTHVCCCHSVKQARQGTAWCWQGPVSWCGGRLQHVRQSAQCTCQLVQRLCNSRGCRWWCVLLHSAMMPCTHNPGTFA